MRVRDKPFDALYEADHFAELLFLRDSIIRWTSLIQQCINHQFLDYSIELCNTCIHNIQLWLNETVSGLGSGRNCGQIIAVKKLALKNQLDCGMYHD